MAEITHFVAGLGTTGTMMGAGPLPPRHRQPGHVRLISMQPDSPFNGLEGLKHLETAIVPPIYDPTVADAKRRVPHRRCLCDGQAAGPRRGPFGRHLGGRQCSHSALQVAKTAPQGSVIVTILCDGAPTATCLSASGPKAPKTNRTRRFETDADYARCQMALELRSFIVLSLSLISRKAFYGGSVRSGEPSRIREVTSRKRPRRKLRIRGLRCLVI